MSKKRYMVIYHKEDNDGVFSAAIAGKYLRDLCKETNMEYSIDFIGENYVELNQETQVPNKFFYWNTEYDLIIMVDISFSEWKYMKKLADILGNKFIWIDHHAPIIKDSLTHEFDGIDGLRDIHHSALYNTYQFFFNPFNSKSVPAFFNLLSQWDSWTYKQEDLDWVKNVNTGTTYKYKLSVQLIDPIINAIIDGTMTDNEIDSLMDSLYSQGKIINDAKAFDIQNIIKFNGDFYWTVGPENESCITLFIQGPSNSLMFESVKDKYKHGLVFKKNLDDTWSFSLYNTSDDIEFHCGEYLNKNYKGGGHKGAAGAIISQTEFNKILKIKHI